MSTLDHESLHIVKTDMAHTFQAPRAAPQPGESTSIEASASELRALVAAVPQFLWIYDGDGHCCGPQLLDSGDNHSISNRDESRGMIERC